MNWTSLTPEQIKAHWRRVTIRWFVVVYLSLLTCGLVGWASGNVAIGALAMIAILWIGMEKI